MSSYSNTLLTAKLIPIESMYTAVHGINCFKNAVHLCTKALCQHYLWNPVKTNQVGKYL